MVLPGPRLELVELLELCADERVTFAAGSWVCCWRPLQRRAGSVALLALTRVNLGGAAVPSSRIEGFERHGLPIIQGWGMTETTPLGTISHLPSDLETIAPFSSTRPFVRDSTDLDPRASRGRGAESFAGRPLPAMGELGSRGPWVAAAYHGGSAVYKFTEDGWSLWEYVVRINERGCMRNLPPVQGSRQVRW